MGCESASGPPPGPTRYSPNTTTRAILNDGAVPTPLAPSGFARWGARVYRHRLATLLTVVIVTLLGGWWGSGVTDQLSQGGFEIPDSESAP